MKAYLIAFDPLSANLPNVHTAVISAPGINEWWHYFSGTYIVTSNLPLSQLRTNLTNNGLAGGWFLLIEVKRNSAGQLPKQAWDWINTKVDP